VPADGATTVVMIGRRIGLNKMKVRRVSGFSLTELVVAMAVAMILMAVSLPSFLRAYHSYRSAMQQHRSRT